MNLNLKDRVAVVTGGAAGIGGAIAQMLAAEGCLVCIADRDLALFLASDRAGFITGTVIPVDGGILTT